MRADQFQGAERLIAALRLRAGKNRILLTSHRAETFSYLKNCFPNDFVLSAPLGRGAAADRFFRRLSPQVLLLLGGGKGPGTAICEKAKALGVPVAVVNGGDEDFPPSSAEGGGICPAGVAATICVPSEEDAAALIKKGIPAGGIHITGYVDLDSAAPPPVEFERAFRRDLGLDGGRYVVLAAGIGPREETPVLEAFSRLLAAGRDAVLLAGADEEQRFDAILASAGRMGLGWGYRTEVRGKSPPVLLLDRPEEFPALYGVADCTILGGGFTDEGRPPNPAKAIVTGRPVIVGPQAPARDRLTKRALREGALLTTDGEGLADLIRGIAFSPEKSRPARERAAAFIGKNEGALEKTLEALEDVLPAEGKAVLENEGWWIDGAVPRLSRTGFGKALTSRLSAGRIDSLEDLHRSLGSPRSILCLGNGPSSEDERVLKVSHDCLFRVNWRWMERGILVRPQLVFVGSFETVRRVKSCIFGFRDGETERVVVLDSIVRPWRGPLRYVTIEGLGASLDRSAPGARPSGGALMVVLAAALRPERLAIGGIDLFLHPAGRYPGDFSSVNSYAQAHSIDNDLEVIGNALKEYHGEVQILGDTLRDALGERDENV